MSKEYLDKTGLSYLWGKIKSLFAPKKRGVEYIRGTWTAASGTWTGVSEDAELYDGKQIILYMPFGGSGNATLNLTLADGSTTGAKNVYFESTTRFTTHKGQNSQLPLIYHKALKLSDGTTYEGWWYMANRDTTINYQMRNGNNIKAKEAIPKYHLAGGTSAGYIKIVSGAVFDISYPLLVTQGAWAANGNYTNGFFEYQDQNIRNMIAALGSSYAGLTAGKMVYLVGTLSGVNFTVDSSFVTCTPPTTANGKAYIPLGIAYSTYQLYFYSQRVVYEYSGGSFHEVNVYARDAAKVNGLTVQTAVPANAKFVTAANVKSALGTGTGTSKYLREDGTWATPPASSANLDEEILKVDSYDDAVGKITVSNLDGQTASNVEIYTAAGVDDILEGFSVNGATVFYGTCSTAAATAAKLASIADYALIPGTYVTIRFANAVPANATLNISSKGAKPIYCRNAKIKANVIKADDTCLFVYDGTNYRLIAKDTNIELSYSVVNTF